MTRSALPSQGDRLEVVPVNDLDYRALFIGDQAENGAIFKELLGQSVDEHLGWRQNYMPGDRPGIAVRE